MSKRIFLLAAITLLLSACTNAQSEESRKAIEYLNSNVEGSYTVVGQDKGVVQLSCPDISGEITVITTDPLKTNYTAVKYKDTYEEIVTKTLNSVIGEFTYLSKVFANYFEEKVSNQEFSDWSESADANAVVEIELKNSTYTDWESCIIDIAHKCIENKICLECTMHTPGGKCYNFNVNAAYQTFSYSEVI